MPSQCPNQNSTSCTKTTTCWRLLKPAGMATMGVSDDKPSLFSYAKDYIKRRYNKPGNVYLGVMSRLDAPVTGVVLFARTSKAAARLTEQFRTHAVEKTYWAVVEGRLATGRGQFHRLPRQGRIAPPHADCRARVAGGQTGKSDISKTLGYSGPGTYRRLVAGRDYIKDRPKTSNSAPVCPSWTSGYRRP